MSPAVERTIGSPISVLEGNSVTLTFLILNANPAVTASQTQWYFNNSVALRPLNNLFGNVLVFSNNYWSLSISNVNYNIQGRISMVANNLAGGGSDYIDIIVEGNNHILYVHDWCICGYIIVCMYFYACTCYMQMCTCKCM